MHNYVSLVKKREKNICVHDRNDKVYHGAAVSCSITVALIDALHGYTPCPGKNGPPKQNAVKCTVYNTIQ